MIEKDFLKNFEQRMKFVGGMRCSAATALESSSGRITA